MVPLAATLAASVVVQEVDESTKENDDKLANDLGRASATKTLEKFSDDIAISFSEEDVALIGGPFLVFFDALLEKLYSIHIDHMFPKAAEVQANVDNQDNNWNFLEDINNVPVNRLSSQGYVSIGSEPCRTRPILPWQHQRKGMWWEDAKAKECSGLNKAVEGVFDGLC